MIFEQECWVKSLSFMKVIPPDGETEYFAIRARVLQGDPLAPFLFAVIVILDFVICKTYNGREELGFLHNR